MTRKSTAINLEVTLLDGTPLFKLNYSGYIPRYREYIQYKGTEYRVRDLNWIYTDGGELDLVQVLVVESIA